MVNRKKRSRKTTQKIEDKSSIRQEINHPLVIKRNYIHILLFLFAVIFLIQLLQINLGFNNIITGGDIFDKDPLSNLGNLFETEISLRGEYYPVWVVLIVFGIIFGIMYTATQLVNFFEGDEKRGARFVVALGISLLTTFATSAVKWVFAISIYVGSLGTIFILLLIGLMIYLYTHKTLRDRVREVWPPGAAGGGGAGPGGGGGQQAQQQNPPQTQQQAQQQKQYPHRGGRLNPRNWFRGNVQQQAQQQNQALAAQWHQEIQAAIAEVNNLLGNRGRNLNDRRIWGAFIQRLNHIENNLQNAFPNMRLLNLNQIRGDANLHAQRCTQNINNPQQNIHRANATRFLRREALACLNAIDAQIP